MAQNLLLFYNNQKQFIEYTPNKGYLSSVDREIHFGLHNTTLVDSLEVIWPNNKRIVITDIKVNKSLSVKPIENYTRWDYKTTKDIKKYLKKERK